MKSKISFFNKTIFWKNVTLYWPIWGIYTLLVFIYQPILFWIINSMGNFYAPYTKTQRFEDLVSCLSFEPYVVIIAGAAVLTGMALYSYLYNHKSANMIHSLPVDRTQLFGTSLISGWAFLIVPLLASTIFTTLLCIGYGVPGIQYVWGWFLAVAALAFIAFAIVTICALFTGHIVVLPIYVVAVNILSWVVYYLVYIVVTTFGYGVSSLSDQAYAIAEMFCPVQCFYNNLMWQHQYADTNELIRIAMDGVGLVVIYMIIAVALYVAAYVIYRKRKIEQAGDFLTVDWVKPIFRAAVGIIGAIFGAMLIREVLLEVRIGCSVPAFVVIMLVIGAICYFGADMFVKKSFHVFKKKNWIGCGVFSVVLLVFFACMYGVAENYERYIPEKAEVEEATVYLGYEITLNGEEASKILEIHGDILEQLDLIESIIESGDRYHESVRIEYQLKNGQFITRRYQLPEEEVIQPILEKIIVLEEDEENFLKNVFCEEYEAVSVFNGGYFEAQFVKEDKRTEQSEYPDMIYESVPLDAAQAEALYEAIIADVKAGTLMKYNIYSKWVAEDGGEVYYKSSDASLSIEYRHPEDDTALDGTLNMSEDSYTINKDDGSYTTEYVDYQSWMGAYISFGPDCENIVNKLIEFEIIESVDDIWWGEVEEVLKTEE